MRRVVVVVVTLLVAALAWFAVRTSVGQVPEAEAPPVDPELAAVRTQGEDELAGRACLAGAWDEEPVEHPLLDVRVAASGRVDACVEVYRERDGDPDADYYQAAITAYWTTEGGWSAPMRAAVDAPPVGPTILSLESSEQHLSNVFVADAAVVGACTGEEHQPQGVGRWWVLYGWCYGEGALESREDGSVANWFVDDQSGLDATVHMLMIKVAEGAEPTLTFTLESPADGSAAVEVSTARG